MSRLATTARQEGTVDRLREAAVDEIRASGYDGLTVRNVARRAGVAPATAYTYFASKDHLVADAFWQRLHALAPSAPDGSGSPPAARVASVLRDITRLIAGEPELAAATTVALLAADRDVKRLRDRIGGEIRNRVAAALGDDADAAILQALDLAVSGAMLQAGMGHLAYDDLPNRVADVARLLLGRRP